MKVLDLFAGLKGWSRPWLDELAEGIPHEVVTVDLDPRFETSIVTDILTWNPRDDLGSWKPDVILASPPCETFSVASIGTHWTGGWRAYEPATEAAKVGKALVERTVGIIVDLEPAAAVIENPRGVLRKLDLIPVEPTTVWYCHYGEAIAKPTDLWGFPFPSGWAPEPVCHNYRESHGPGCCCRDHERAPRGAKTGTQGRGDAASRAVVPFGLADSIRRAL